MWIERYLLPFAAGLYVLAELLASSLPGLSRLAHLGLALMLLALLMRVAAGSLVLRTEPLLVIFGLFFLVAFASVLWSGDSPAAFVRSISVLTAVLGAATIWVGFWNGLSLRWIAGCAAVGAVVQAVVALNQLSAYEGERVAGLVSNPNTLAIQLSMVAFLLLLVGGRNFAVGLLALALIVVATLASGSRKMVFVWLTYFLLLSRWLLLGLRRSTITAAAILLLVPASMFALIETRAVWMAPIADLTVYQRVERALAGDDRSTSVRSDLIQLAISDWTNSPVWGYGLDQFRYMNDYGLYAHNNYAELLVDLGLVGFLLYYAIHAFLVIRAAQVVRLGSRRGWLILLLVFMLLLLDLAYVSHTDRLGWLMLALAGFTSEQEERKYARSNDRTDNLAFSVS